MREILGTVHILHPASHSLHWTRLMEWILALFILVVFAALLKPKQRRKKPLSGETAGVNSWGVSELTESGHNLRSPSSNPRPEAALVGKCWVIDGDTIDIGGTRIRLAGIDAPELDHPYGKNAKWALVRLCKGAQIRAVFDGSLSHDRTVATCYLPDGRDLSAEMVKLGMAVDWAKFSGGKYRNFETPEARRLLWRCDARQKGRMPASSLPN